jgi:energy-coupling factor transporter ATP-binding protein EcfA2
MARASLVPVSLKPLDKLPTIRVSERASFIGPTGSGKTELARAFLRHQRNVIILDTKKSEIDDWQTVGESVDEKEVYRTKGGRFVYHVEPDFLIDPSRPERFFRWALKGGNRVIYIDELLDIIEVPGLKILATQGRSNNCGLWIATQRPHGVPIFAISEADATFVFRLRVDRDRERMEAATGTHIPWDRLRADYSFVYIDKRGDLQGPAHLNL